MEIIPMIKVSLSDLILIGMALGVVLVCTLWVVAVIRDRRLSQRIRNHTVFCRICGSAYQTESTTEVTVCPVCKTPNEKNTMSAI